MRDLGIDAKVQTFTLDEATGNVVSAAPKTFGDKANSNFKPVFDESEDVGGRIQDADALTDQSAKLADFSLM